MGIRESTLVSLVLGHQRLSGFGGVFEIGLGHVASRATDPVELLRSWLLQGSATVTGERPSDRERGDSIPRIEIKKLIHANDLKFLKYELHSSNGIHLFTNH